MSNWIKSSRCESSACVKVMLPAKWTKSSRCDTSSCVEVMAEKEMVLVRDSKDPDGPVLQFTRGEWQRFTDFIKGM